MARNPEAYLESLLRPRSAKKEPYEILSEALSQYKEDRQWRERKNIQRQQIMGQLAQGTSMIFNDKDLTSRKERFQSYFNKYKGKMDEATLEMGQFMLDGFDEPLGIDTESPPLSAVDPFAGDFHCD